MDIQQEIFKRDIGSKLIGSQVSNVDGVDMQF
jgi:hypothetical protein